jgi:hypothetical protein
VPSTSPPPKATADRRALARPQHRAQDPQEEEEKHGSNREEEGGEHLLGVVVVVERQDFLGSVVHVRRLSADDECDHGHDHERDSGERRKRGPTLLSHLFSSG